MASNLYTNIRWTLQSDSPLPIHARYRFRKAFRAYAEDNLLLAFLEMLACLDSLSKTEALKNEVASQARKAPSMIKGRAFALSAEQCLPLENYVLFVFENLFGSFAAAQSHRQAFKRHCASVISDPTGSISDRINPLFLVSALGEVENQQLLAIAEKQYRMTRIKREGKLRLKEVISFLKLLIKRRENPENFSGKALIFGPAYDRQTPPGIHHEETLIRVNQIPDPDLSHFEYKGNCDRLYLNAEFFEKKRAETIELARRDRLRVYLREKHAEKESMKAGNPSIFYSYQRPKNLFISGYANMIQGVCYSLLREGFHEARLSGIDFYSGSVLYRAEHYSADKELNETLKTLRKHNLIENFAFIKLLYNVGMITAADKASESVHLSLEEYAEILDERIGRPCE